MANELYIIALECKLLLVKFDVPLPTSIQEGLKVSVVVYICLTLCFSDWFDLRNCRLVGRSRF